MNKKRLIKKILILGAWTIVLGGMATLLVAANRKKQEHLCREVIIGLKGESEKFFIEKEDVAQLLTKAAGGSLVHRPVASIDLANLEWAVERSDWIRNAELYFDSKDALHVFVEEREPVARVFTTNGKSFYIDSSAHQMPLLDKMSARVPVMTGYPPFLRKNAADSALLWNVKTLSAFINRNSFWNAQIGQVDITPERQFELIPVVGNHVIRLGDATGLDDKFERLQVFYKQVLAKGGFDMYQTLDLSFKGQVVAVRKGPISAIDSIQLKKNIEELMTRASLQTVDESMLPQKQSPDTAKAAATNPDPKPLTQQAASKKTARSKPVETPVKASTPKAVMPKRH